LLLVPVSAVDDEILLLPVRMRHVKNVRTWFYTDASNNIQSYYICEHYVRVSQPFTSAAVKCVLPTYTSSLYRPIHKYR